MKKLGFKYHNFVYCFFEKNKVPFFYEEIKNVPKTYYVDNIDEANEVQIVNYIMPYIGRRKITLKDGYDFYSKSYRLGYAMDFSNSSSATNYLKNVLGKKTYKNLRQDRQRLHRDYNIQLKVYYGDINEDNYQILFKTLKEYILKRFEGRVHKHTALSKWNFYVKSCYNMILAKNAALFVLYNNNSPIAISLGYTHNNILKAAISSFDESYYKYSLGKLMFVNQIEWCFLNNFKLLDTGWGKIEYKIKFSNAIFYYDTKVFYPKDILFKKMVAFLISWVLFIQYFCVIICVEKTFKRPKKVYKNRWLELNSSKAYFQ